MAQGISEIRDRAAQIIEATTPDVDARLPFREASYITRLEDLPLPETAAERMRAFHVLPEPPFSVQAQGSSCVDILGQLVVRVRYDWRGWDDHTRLRQLRTMVAADQARIAKSMRLPPVGQTWNDVVPFTSADFALAGAPVLVPGKEGLAIAECRFRFRYELK